MRSGHSHSKYIARPLVSSTLLSATSCAITQSIHVRALWLMECNLIYCYLTIDGTRRVHVRWARAPSNDRHLEINQNHSPQLGSCEQWTFHAMSDAITTNYHKFVILFFLRFHRKNETWKTRWVGMGMSSDVMRRIVIEHNRMQIHIMQCYLFFSPFFLGWYQTKQFRNESHHVSIHV